MNYMDEISRMPAGEQELAISRLQTAAPDMLEVCSIALNLLECLSTSEGGNMNYYMVSDEELHDLAEGRKSFEDVAVANNETICGYCRGDTMEILAGDFNVGLSVRDNEDGFCERVFDNMGDCHQNISDAIRWTLDKYGPEAVAGIMRLFNVSHETTGE